MHNQTGRHTPTTLPHQLYQQGMLAHHKHPIGFNKNIVATHRACGKNHTCGDSIMLEIASYNQSIDAISFNGDSCAICRASASILCENLEGLTIEKSYEFSQAIIFALKYDKDFVDEFSLKCLPLMGVRRFPARKVCALLPWETFLLALNN